MPNPEQLKRLAELGSLMVCAPVAVKLLDRDTGKPTEVTTSLINLIIEIAQGLPFKYPMDVRRSVVDEDGNERDVIQNTNIAQLLAEIADHLNDLCYDCEEDDDDDDEEDDDDRIVRPAPKGGYKRKK
jgi:hypothetical protein